jgi:hypothetical protein
LGTASTSLRQRRGILRCSAEIGGMKNLLACLAILAAFNVTAQTETSNFPYNPDSDGDGLIGVSDLVNLLGFYESQFSVSAQLNSDSTSAVYFPTGWNTELGYYDCLSRCDSLPGPWHLISHEGVTTHLGVIMDSVSTISNGLIFWQKGWGDLAHHSSGFMPTAFVYSTEYHLDGYESYPRSSYNSGGLHCLCELRQRPRVEYDFCEGNMTQVQSCAADKVSEGWYPLEFTSAGSSFVQTFWRWED